MPRGKKQSKAIVVSNPEVIPPTQPSNPVPTPTEPLPVVSQELVDATGKLSDKVYDVVVEHIKSHDISAFIIGAALGRVMHKLGFFEGVEESFSEIFGEQGSAQ